ncbi:Retrovirus-related Pol polyprotein from transposon TNT 1-94 [Dendrobium catenatum]|uniref:Retrovirus-related Pol polyprotein from transposon TNT 1-94 n=1 Tax=Dendrobium catenatum TaxID=906689 RepID=A0A2I0VNN8_9ASPA|nr:Retrovirus-related Pol polyprotein from transposon TNT 1-94 [Dendrobium catenatum]
MAFANSSNLLCKWLQRLPLRHCFLSTRNVSDRTQPVENRRSKPHLCPSLHHFRLCSSHVITLKTSHEVWITLERRLKQTNRSSVIQLKNELHQIQMKDRTMQQYLAQIKILVDSITASSSTVDTEDIILYILNGLPSTYNAFKTAIRTSLNPISLDTLYSLLCSEEIILHQEQAKESNQQPDLVALLSSRNSSTRGRYNRYRGRGSNSRSPSNSNPPNQSQNSLPKPTCQICGKNDHSALNYWHRCNLNYVPPSTTKALTAQQQHSSTVGWVLDSGASSHLISDLANLNLSTPYTGVDSVSIANGNTLSIHNSGQGILPIPDSMRKLHLRNILHVSSISHNLLSISKLIVDNNVKFVLTLMVFLLRIARTINFFSKVAIAMVSTTSELYLSTPPPLLLSRPPTDPHHVGMPDSAIRIFVVFKH